MGISWIWRRGEVLEESPVCLDARCESPPVRDREEWLRRQRAAPMLQARRVEWRVLSVKAPAWLVEGLDRVVQEYGWSSRSRLIREVLERFLSRPGGPLDVSEELRAMRNLYALRGFAMAAQHLLSMARVYAPGVYMQDLDKIIEELEALIHHLNGDLNELNRKLDLW